MSKDGTPPCLLMTHRLSQPFQLPAHTQTTPRVTSGALASPANAAVSAHSSGGKTSMPKVGTSVRAVKVVPSATGGSLSQEGSSWSVSCGDKLILEDVAVYLHQEPLEDLIE